MIAIDFIGPFPTSTSGVKFILTTIDAFPKYVVLYPIKKHNGPAVLNLSKNDYFLKYGKPECLLMDNATQFTSENFLNEVRQVEVQLSFVAIRHPSSNIVERIHEEITRVFGSLIKNKHAEWESWTSIIQNC